MASFTNQDLQNATLFSNVNLQIRLLELAYKKAPHLISHLQITIRDATDEDYYIPAALSHCSKVINIDITENLCKLLSCNPSKEKGVCKESDTASYYRVGDESFDLQCQPACFNILETHKYDENGKIQTDMPMLNYFNGECVLMPSSVNAYLEKPFYRSTVHYEARLNDMPTGFSRAKSNTQFGTGITYENNKTYCKYYDRIMNYDKSCDSKVWEKVLDPFISKSFIDFVRSSKRYISSLGNSSIPDPENLPPYPTVPYIYTLNGWKNNINKSFEIPNLINTEPQKIKLENVKHSRHKQEYHIQNHSNEENITYIDSSTLTDDNDSTFENIFNHTYDRLNVALKFAIDLILGILGDVALSKIKGFLINLVDKISVLIGKELSKLIITTGDRVFSAAIKGIVVKTLTRVGIQIVGKLAILLAKLAIAAISIINIIFFVTMIFDFILVFWDPFGYNNLFPSELPADIYKNSEQALRQLSESPNVNYKFDTLLTNILSKDELYECYIQSLVDTANYLDALVVNSEGSLIDKGKKITWNGKDLNITEKQNKALINRIRFDPASYYDYNKSFFHRVETNKLLLKFAKISSILCVGFTCASMNLIALLFILITIICLFLSRLELQSSNIQNMLTKLNYKFKLFDSEMDLSS